MPGDSTFGRYRMERRLGVGGFGEVWCAWDPQLNRRVALKLLKRAGPEDLARFKREAEATARLDHPGIATIYECGEVGDQAYLALEFIEGRTLTAWRGEPREAVRLLRDAAAAVHHAHLSGVLHRDLKPDNLMVDAAGRVRVMDFGLARVVEVESSISQSGFAVGTPAFMPPEQARGERHVIEVRSDVYGLGATLYAVLTGRAPFEGRTTFDILVNVIESEPAPPATGNAELDAIVMKCLEKEKARRYATAAGLAADLDRWLAGEPVSARRSGAGRRVARAVGRRKLVIGLAIAGVMLVAGGVLLLRRTQSSADTATSALLPRMRETAKTCLDAALAARKVGSFDAMEAHAERLRATCAEVIAAMPGLAEPHVLMGMMYATQLKDAEADAELSRALSKEPSNEEARYRLGLLRAAVYYRRIADLSRVARVFRAEQEEDDEARRLKRDALELLLGRDNALSRCTRAALQGTRHPEVPGLAREFPDEEMTWALRIASQEDEVALKVANEAIAWDAGFIDVREIRGRILLKQAESDEQIVRALADVETATRLGPRVARAWAILASARCAAAGWMKDGSGQFALAVEAAERANELGSPLGLSRLALIRLLRANHEQQRGHDATALYRRAMEAATAAIAVPETAAQGCVMRAEARLGLTEIDDTDEALAQLRLAIEDARRSVELGWTGANGPQVEGQAETWLGRVLSVRDEPGAEEAFERAERALNIAVELAPSSADARVDRASLYVSWGSYLVSRKGRDASEWFMRAEKDLQTALSGDPRSVPAAANRVQLYATWGACELQWGRPPDALLNRAISESEELLKRAPWDATVRRSRRMAFTGLGMARRQRKENAAELFEKAMVEATAVLAARVATADDWIMRGRIQSEWGIYCSIARTDASTQFDGAIKDFETAQSMSPRDGAVLVHLGGVHANYAIFLDGTNGDAPAQFRKAADVLDRAIAAKPTNALAWHYRGNVDYSFADYLRRHGKRADEECKSALAKYERAEKLEPSLKAALAPKRKWCEEYLKAHQEK